MSDPQKTVFISYRRSASKHLARSIFMDLRANGYDVFLDVNTIDNGAFDTIILNQIAARAHFILLLSPGSMERCANEGDWLRREIEEAIRLERNIVPIFEEGVNFAEDIQTLPMAMQSHLARMSGVRILHDYFEEGMEKIRNRFLRTPVYIELKPTPNSEEEEVNSRISLSLLNNIDRDSVDYYFERGLAKGDQKNWVGQINDMNLVIQREPGMVGAYLNRGLAFEQIGEYEDALKDYAKAILLNPEKRSGYSRKALLFVKMKKYPSAIEEYTNLIKHIPDDAYTYLTRATLLEKQGNKKDALRDYEKFIQLNRLSRDIYDAEQEKTTLKKIESLKKSLDLL